MAVSGVYTVNLSSTQTLVKRKDQIKLLFSDP